MRDIIKELREGASILFNAEAWSSLQAVREGLERRIGWPDRQIEPLQQEETVLRKLHEDCNNKNYDIW